MRIRTHLLALCPILAALAAPVAAEPQGAFFLRDGDRVVFYGDSITQDGGYARVVEEYTRTRFPAWDLRFYNAGVGGDRVGGGAAGDSVTRIERDVIALHPTVVTIMLGMNDGSYRASDPEIEGRFTSGYRAIVARLRKEAPEARLFLILPSPFDDVSRAPLFPGGYDSVLRRMGRDVAAIADENHLGSVDFGAPLNSGIASVFAHNPELARTLLPDRVHPSNAGHMVLGAALLRAWHAPALVSLVGIDARKVSVGASENTEVKGLHADGQRLSWVQLDKALPLPLNYDDASVATALEAGAALDALDQETLQVANLAQGRYELRIDDSMVGTFSAAELGAGINLALRNTPMRGQAYSVLWGSDGGHELERVRRNLLAHGPATPESSAAAAALAARDESDQAERSRGAVPKERAYSLAPVP